MATEYRFSSAAPGLSVNGGAYYLSKRAVNQFNQAFIPGYTLFDIGAAYSRSMNGGEITFRVLAQNANGKRYFSSTGGGLIAQGPPGTVKFSVTTRF